MSDPESFDITKETDESLEAGIAEGQAELLRRKRESVKYACIDCGHVMDYDYVDEGPFEEQGCRICGHLKAVELQEAATK